jgi:uncharacterized membrane protein YkvA (DUF1232 family)
MSMKISIQSIYSWYRNAIRNPKYRWWIIIGTLAYVLSPFDIAPDLIPFVGEIDDFILVSLIVTEVSQMVLDRFKASKSNPAATPTATSDETIEINAVSAD